MAEMIAYWTTTEGTGGAIWGATMLNDQACVIVPWQAVKSLAMAGGVLERCCQNARRLDAEFKAEMVLWCTSLRAWSPLEVNNLLYELRQFARDQGANRTVDLAIAKLDGWQTAHINSWLDDLQDKGDREAANG